MSFYIQHGYGKAQKIAQLADTGRVAGVVLSPGDEDPNVLRATAADASTRGLDVLIDPQAYLYSTRPEGRGRNHADHGIEISGLSWAQDSQTLTDYISRLGRFFSNTNAEGRWIAPGPLQASFADLWTPLSVQFARTASQAWGEDRTFATVAVEQAGLADWGAIERWLDVATTLPVAGVYLLVGRPATRYPGDVWPPQQLANLLRIIHVLSTLNEYEVIWGYSDIEGILGISAGAVGMATGWSYTLRQFSSAKWTSPPGARRAAVVRTHVARLWSLPRAVQETEAIFESHLRDRVFTRSEIDEFGSRNFADITRGDAQLQHLRVVARRAARVSALPQISDRLDMVYASLDHALGLWSEIGASGLLSDPSYRARLVSFREALTIFRDAVAL